MGSAEDRLAAIEQALYRSGAGSVGHSKTHGSDAHLSGQTVDYAADTAASDAYAIALTPIIIAYATGQEFRFKATTANTGAATLNVNGLGAVTIKKLHDQDLATGDIEAGQIVTVVYDGTNFQMQSQIAQIGGGPHDAVTLGAGSDAALALSGQELTLADVLTPTEHTAIGNGAPHHAESHSHASHSGIGASDHHTAYVAADHTAVGDAAPHHAEAHDYDIHSGGVPYAELEYDDATSNPLIDGEAAADGVENSAARKDHVHPKHHVAYVAADHTAVGDSSPHHATASASGAHTIAAQVITAVAASDTLAAHVELATIAETNTGTDATRATTPDGIAGSVFGEVVLQMTIVDYTTDVATGDGKYYIHVDDKFAGMDLVRVHAEVITAGTTGTMDIQIANVDAAVDMLSTKLTIDSGETGSDTAATPAVINTSNDDVQTNEVLRIDVDAVQTTKAKGLIVTLGFRLP